MTKAKEPPVTAPHQHTMPDVPSSIAMLFGWNMEMAQFYFGRYQQYCTSPVQFMACKSMEEVQVQQAEFLQKLMQDYRENAGRLSRIARMDQPAKSADEAYSAKLLKAQEDAAAIIELAREQAERILKAAEKRTAKPDADKQSKPEKKRA
jgi:hypothetical protein